MNLGRFGIWSPLWSVAVRSGDADQLRTAVDAAAELEALGYGALWLGQSPGVEFAAPLLAGTTRITVATGITSIWAHDAGQVAAQRAQLEARHPGRFLLGLGVSHGELHQEYAHPYAAMRRFLADLDAAPSPVPAAGRVLAALGPKMLALSRDGAAGAHPYLVTADQVAQARTILGPDRLLAPDFKVVLDADLDRARATARSYLARYLAMRNYTTSFARAGFSDDDLRDGGSVRLLDAVFALGDADTVATKLTALLDAGADHVAIQVVPTAQDGPPLAQWRRLADRLDLGRAA